MTGKIMFVLIILIQSLPSDQAPKRRFKLEVYNFTCNIMTGRMRRFDCNYRKVSNNHFLFNQYLMFNGTLNKSFNARLLIYVRPQNGRKTIKFLDLNLNICEGLSKPIGNQLIVIILNEMKRASNIPRRCPFKGNFLYKIENLTFNDDYMPPYAPFMNFSYTFEFYDKGQLFAASTLMGATVP